MAENISKIINNGFGTFTKNPIICVPFIVNFFISAFIGLIMISIGLAEIFGSSLSSMENITPEESVSILRSLMGQHITEIIILTGMILFVIFFIQAYFISGAIGMAIQASESGKTSIFEMRSSGKKNLLNMFLADILFSLLCFAGIVFMVPGAMKVDISQILNPEYDGPFVLLAGGFILWMVYLLVLTIILAVFRYALVSEKLGPLESMSAAYSFFRKNTQDVVLLFLTIFMISVGFMIIDQVMGLIPFVKFIWAFISMFISLFVIPPLTTIWWVRLYLIGTGRKLYIDDLLAHPNDLHTLQENNR